MVFDSFSNSPNIPNPSEAVHFLRPVGITPVGIFLFVDSQHKCGGGGGPCPWAVVGPPQSCSYRAILSTLHVFLQERFLRRH